MSLTSIKFAKKIRHNLRSEDQPTKNAKKMGRVWILVLFYCAILTMSNSRLRKFTESYAMN